MLLKIKNIILYGGLDKKEFVEIKPDIYAFNIKRLRLLSIISSIIFFLLFAAAVAGASYAKAYILDYALCTVCSLMIYLAVGRISNGNAAAARLVLPLCYLFMVMVFIMGAGLSVADTSRASVTAVVMLMVLPVLFNDVPVRLISLIICAAFLQSILTIIYKSPSIVPYDIWNEVVFALMSILLSSSASVISIGVMDSRHRAQKINIMQKRLNAAMQDAVNCHNPDDAIERLMEHVGRALNSERAYIFEDNANPGYMDNTYEWCAEGVSTEADILQNVDKNLFAWWFDIFDRRENIIIYDVEDIKLSNPETYGILKPQNINRLIACPVFSDGKVVAFFGIDNPNRDEMEYASQFLDLIRNFLVSMRQFRSSFRLKESMAETDLMTGLLNRGNGEERIRTAVVNDTEGMFCIMDINRFKAINDTFGHQVGDKVIMEISAAFRSSFRESDIIMRLGGDEFAAYLNGIGNVEAASEIVDRFFKKVEDLVIPEMGDTRVTVSLGAAFHSGKEQETFDGVYRKADSALYMAKTDGGNAIRYFEEE